MALQFNRDELVSALQSNSVGNFCCVAASIVVIYDHLSTLPREVELIWGRRSTSVTILFYLNRWTIFVWAVMTGIVGSSLPLSTLQSCITYNHFGETINLILYALWAVFSAIRTYAVSGGNWPVALAVFILSLVPVGTNTYGDFFASWYQMADFPIVGEQCYSGVKISPTMNAQLTVSTRICVIASDVLILIVTWVKTWHLKREFDRLGMKAEVSSLLLRDGTLYFLALLCMNILNIAGQVTDVFAYAASFSTPLSSIIITHFLLNLRQAAYGTDEEATITKISFVRTLTASSKRSSFPFAAFVGNMGEHLCHGIDRRHPDLHWTEVDGEHSTQQPQGDTDGLSLVANISHNDDIVSLADSWHTAKDA